MPGRKFVGRRRRYSDEDLARVVADASSIADALRQLGLVPRGGNYRTLRSRIRYLNLDTSHFLGQGWRKGVPNQDVPTRSLAEILVECSMYKGYRLKERLIRAGLKEAACERCLRTTWNGLAIPLELDHVNGRADDNRLENLRLLCPNCHAQTPTYRGRNIGKAR